MHIKTIKTHCVKQGDTIESILERYVPTLQERSVLAFTSKVISICQDRVVAKDSIDKATLVKQEAGAVADIKDPPYGIQLTITNGILTPSAAIDESNAGDVYILYPKDVQKTATEIWTYLRNKNNIKELGVIITDSNITPLRRGVTGVTLGWCGFEPLYSYVGKPDIYGRELRVAQTNLLDCLATTAVMMMGEGDEQTPLAVFENLPEKISFLPRPPTTEEEKSIIIPIEEDLYAPFLRSTSWKS